MSFILSKDMKRDSGLHSFEIILFKSYQVVGSEYCLYADNERVVA